jgi:hypothetical protein
MLRTLYRARYFKCASVVGALWHPSFIRAGLLVCASAGLHPAANAAAPDD